MREKIGVELRVARVDFGATQADVAKALRMSQSTWSRIERGLCPLDLVEFIDFCDFIEMPPGTMLDHVDAVAHHGVRP